MSILPPRSLRSPSWARQEPASGKVGRIMVQKGANSEQFVKESKLGTTLTRQELSLAIVFMSLRDQDCPHEGLHCSLYLQNIVTKLHTKCKVEEYGSSNSFLGGHFLKYFSEIVIVSGVFYCGGYPSVKVT